MSTLTLNDCAYLCPSVKVVCAVQCYSRLWNSQWLRGSWLW